MEQQKTDLLQGTLEPLSLRLLRAGAGETILRAAGTVEVARCWVG